MYSPPCFTFIIWVENKLKSRQSCRCTKETAGHKGKGVSTGSNAPQQPGGTKYTLSFISLACSLSFFPSKLFEWECPIQRQHSLFMESFKYTFYAHSSIFCITDSMLLAFSFATILIHKTQASPMRQTGQYTTFELHNPKALNNFSCII